MACCAGAVGHYAAEDCVAGLEGGVWDLGEGEGVSWWVDGSLRGGEGGRRQTRSHFGRKQGMHVRKHYSMEYCVCIAPVLGKLSIKSINLRLDFLLNGVGRGKERSPSCLR